MKKELFYEYWIVEKVEVFRQFDVLQLGEGGDFEALHCQPSKL
jgi:hypothetical protein